MAHADEAETEIARCADALAARLTDGHSFADAVREAGSEYRELLQAVARLDARLAFDREGRPAAIAAVREALPLVEQELFDAIVEDHACEVAAVEEALYRLARAYGRLSAGGR